MAQVMGIAISVGIEEDGQWGEGDENRQRFVFCLLFMLIVCKIFEVAFIWANETVAGYFSLVMVVGRIWGLLIASRNASNLPQIVSGRFNYKNQEGDDEAGNRPLS